MNWIKDFQSVGRGIRNAKATAVKPSEVTVFTSGFRVGKSVILDIESDTFTKWDDMLKQHWVEFRDYDNGKETVRWVNYDRQPRLAVIYRASTIIRQNSDGSYEYIKNRVTGELRKLNEKEEKQMVWTILRSENKQ